MSKLKVKNGPHPFNRGVAFAIRDDDVSYFTQPWMLDMLYGEAWKLGFKVSLAVIPYVKGTRLRFVPRSLSSSKRFFSISENRELVDYLLKKIEEGYVDVVQHGYTHAREDGKPEFAINDFRCIDERLKKGKRFLNETFERDITVFAAPHDGVSRAAWKSIRRNGMHLCRKFTLGRFLMTAPISSLNFRELAKTVIRCPDPFKPIPTSLINLADMLVIQWDAIFWSQSRKRVAAQLEDAKGMFLKRLNGRETFVLLHHHWDYFCDMESRSMKQDMLTCFEDFLNFASSHDEVWKTTLSEICFWAKTRLG